MEWKKETLSKSELERMQKEYSERAMSMRSRAAAAQEETVPETAVTAQLPEPTEEPAEEVFEEVTSEISEESAADDKVSESENYGVYSAEEVIGRSGESESMKKASEILEEIARQNDALKRNGSGRKAEDGAG